MLDRDGPAGVADELVPRQGDAGLDETRARTDDGSTDSRYASSCSANHSSDGADTTRVATPAASSVSRASTASCTSEPVPMRITSGVPLLASSST